jgi:hypothetical protein
LKLGSTDPFANLLDKSAKKKAQRDAVQPQAKAQKRQPKAAKNKATMPKAKRKAHVDLTLSSEYSQDENEPLPKKSRKRVAKVSLSPDSALLEMGKTRFFFIISVKFDGMEIKRINTLKTIQEWWSLHKEIQDTGYEASNQYTRKEGWSCYHIEQKATITGDGKTPKMKFDNNDILYDAEWRKLQGLVEHGIGLGYSNWTVEVTSRWSRWKKGKAPDGHAAAIEPTQPTRTRPSGSASRAASTPTSQPGDIIPPPSGAASATSRLNNKAKWRQDVTAAIVAKYDCGSKCKHRSTLCLKDSANNGVHLPFTSTDISAWIDWMDMHAVTSIDPPPDDLLEKLRNRLENIAKAKKKKTTRPPVAAQQGTVQIFVDRDRSPHRGDSRNSRRRHSASSQVELSTRSCRQFCGWLAKEKAMASPLKAQLQGVGDRLDSNGFIPEILQRTPDDKLEVLNILYGHIVMLKDKKMYTAFESSRLATPSP